MLKRIYKLIITKENFYRDIQLNGLDHFENSNYNHFKIDLPMDECGSFSLSVIMKDASCSVSLDHNLKIRGSNDELGSTALLHCGDRFSIYAQDGHPLYQCEMALCELRGSSENVDYNLAIKVDGEVINQDDKHYEYYLLNKPSGVYHQLVMKRVEKLL